MLGLLSTFIIVHSIYSTLRWRLFIQNNNEDMVSLPSDILIEIIFGALLACMAIVSQTNKLQKINAFFKTTTYDKSFERKNFKDYHSSRAQLLGQIMKEKMNIKELD